MPELPEVETVARDLRRHLLPDGRPGPRIVAARITWARTLRDEDPQAFAAGVADRQIEAIGRRGKLLVVDLSGGAVVTIHLKMTGQLFVVPAGTPEDPYVRLALALDDGREVRFRDVRKFGRVALLGRDAATGRAVDAAGAPAFAGVGPEPLDPAFTLAAFRSRLRSRRRRLKPLLTDQAFIAGVGNIYADEALWGARLHPLRSSARLRPAEERRLHGAIRSILAEAVERRGSSIDDYTAPDGDGAMQEQLRVYQRAGQPCPRCGRPVRRIVLAGRSTHFCSWCQRLPAADRPGTAAVLATARVPRAHGRRWTESAPAGALGLTVDEAAQAAARERAQRTRRAAAARRAMARAGTASVPPAGRSAEPIAVSVPPGVQAGKDER
ncbi:MAG: bifunctional DNA-formamidopyrimidine glycosylase/DNA-(apurinic or apyrimidinic site) lyase [Chloroflexi bacterium]|nr:bifunctional DNA-formamidopyrimidine glycosylase/DNA-(apurinic or apyrimidinic site) lyase [Chloroflexota bacterium]